MTTIETLITEMKDCLGCNLSFSLGDFYKKGINGYSSKCKQCSRESAKIWHYKKENRERRNAMARTKYSPRQKKNSVLKAAYGINIDVFDEMIEHQKGLCAICGSNEPDGRGSWHVDHDHNTGTIRALLCHHCNLLIGNAKESINTLQATISYLEKWKGK